MIEQLREIYQDSVVGSVDNESAYYRLELGQEVLYILESQLDNTQKALLALLNTNPLPKSECQDNARYWREVLEGNDVATPLMESIMFVYVYARQPLTRHNQLLWADILQEALPQVEAVLPLSDTQFTVVVRWTKDLPSIKHCVQEVVGALEADFATTIVAGIGQRHAVNEHLSHVYQFEQQLMHTYLPHCQGIVEWSHLLLKKIGTIATKQVPLLTTLKQIIDKSDDYKRTIRALFEHQGNVTHAAESLFIHRNTLMYRTQKFAKETQLNLHHLPELALCYLLLDV